MKINAEGLALIKEFEGLYLTAYMDAVNVITIGYGTTNADASIIGVRIRPGMKISRATAEEWLVECLDKKYMPLVMKYDNIYHWTENEASALCSFAYNIGSIKQLTDNGRRSKAVIAEKMLLYNKAGGKVLAGLTRRRKAERALYLKSSHYTGAFPKLPPRGYYQLGDGYEKHKSYSTNIKRVQKLANWILDRNLKVDGAYGPNTSKAVIDLQKRFGLPVNGCFGKKCLEASRNYKK